MSESTVLETSPSPRRVFAATVVIVLIAGALAARGILARSAQDHALKEKVEVDAIPTVRLVSPGQGEAREELVLPGNIQPYFDAPIYARVPGYLKKWNADIGAQVKAGDVLAEIESPELDQQAQQARADLATAKVKEQVAEGTAKRWESMLGSSAVSKQETEDKTGDYEAKRAEVNASQANVDRLEAMISFKRVVAPFDGVVTARKTDIGALINAGSGTGPELFHVADMRKLRIYVQVPQTYAARIRNGMKAVLRLPEQPGRSYPAVVVSSSGSINESSRTMLVQLEADNSNGELISGSYADVHFDLPSAGGVLQLPVTTLLFRQDGLEIATVDHDNKTVLKPIELGRDFGTKVEVVSGLLPTDRVIDSPPDWLAAGDSVRITDDSPHEEKIAGQSEDEARPSRPAPVKGKS
jgi:RND family efflux transporter MFP subunit